MIVLFLAVNWLIEKPLRGREQSSGEKIYDKRKEKSLRGRAWGRFYIMHLPEFD